MHRIFTTLFICCLFISSAFSQLVINEIMYNPPEAGDDSLEYVEIINSSANTVNLAGYKLADGIGGNLPAIDLASGGIVIIAKDSVAILTVFGKPSYQWTTGSLNNTGESITIRNNNDDIIDEVNFMEVSPWPGTQADGTGSSLELCAPELNNNDGSNWKASETATGIFINNIEIKASPGTANGLSCTIEPDYIIEVKNFEFVPKDITINLGETVRWSNLGGHHNVNGTQTVYPNNPASFSNGALSTSFWTYDFTFNIAGKYDYRCDAHFSGGMVGTVTVIEPQVIIPKYPIALITTFNQDGVADSLNVVCEVEGVVYGINQRPGGLQFTIIDENNNGLAVFNNSSELGYTVTEGERISVIGKIEQFNGLTQIVVTQLSVLDQSSTLVNPKEVLQFEENDESSLLAVNSLNYVDIAQWKGDGTSFNVEFTDGINAYTIRIDNDSELSNMSAPAAPLRIIGLLGQFDNSLPFTSGYQLLPRYAADVITISSTDEDDADYKINVSPNPFNDNLSINTVLNIQNIKVLNSKGELVLKCTHNNLDLSGLDSGLYFLQMMTNKGIQVVKVVKI